VFGQNREIRLNPEVEKFTNSDFSNNSSHRKKKNINPKGILNLSSISYKFPPEGINFPRINDNLDNVDINIQEAINLAKKRAEWENPNAVIKFGSIIPIYDFNESIIAYDIDFTIDGTEFESYENVVKDWNAYLNKIQKPILDSIGEEYNKQSLSDLKSDRYYSVTVSATFNNTPIQVSRFGLSNYYTTAWRVKSGLKKALSFSSIRFIKIYYGGTWQRFYEFHDGHESILIEGQEPFSYYNRKLFQYFIKKKKKKNEKKIIGKIDGDWELKYEDQKNKYRSKNKQIYDKWIENKFPAADEKYIPDYDTDFKPLRWFGGCAPTSAAMLMVYWDEKYNYGRLNYWFQEDNDPVHDTNICRVASCTEYLINSIGTGSDGVSKAYNIYPGIQNYASAQGYCFSGGMDWESSIFGDWHWDESKNEIDAGYPFVWTTTNYPGATNVHSVAVVGYDESTEEFICYDTSHYWGNLLNLT